MVWKQRELLKELIVADFKVRYQNMSLGFLWSLLSPFSMALVLYFVFRNMWHVVYTPYARIRHYESATRSNTWESGLDKFREKCDKLFPRDPYYSPHLSQRYGDYRISLPWLGDLES